MSQLCESLPLDTRKHRSRLSDRRCPQTVLLFPVCRYANAISSCRTQFRLNLYTAKIGGIDRQPVGQDKVSCMLLAADARQETSQDLCASMRTISHQTHVGEQALGDARGKRHTAVRLHCAHSLNPNPPRGERPSRCDPQEARFLTYRFEALSSHAKQPVSAANRPEPGKKRPAKHAGLFSR
jgi:hypothetical protein